jgi:hypothetical protein
MQDDSGLIDGIIMNWDACINRNLERTGGDIYWGHDYQILDDETETRMASLLHVNVPSNHRFFTSGAF